MENIELDFARRIEQVIHAYLKESRAAVAAAVERSFNVGPGGKVPGHEKAQKVKAAKRRPGVRRPADQIKNLRESFFRAVQEYPGETLCRTN